MPDNQEMFRIDDSRMPVRLGSALRVPSYAYDNWGIPLGAYRIESDACYTGEWREGSPQQMQYVIDAVLEAGLGNNSQILRDSCARVVSHLVKKTLTDPGSNRPGKKKIHYLDIGAGVSTVNVFDAIDYKYKESVFFTLMEPSEKRVRAAAEKLTEKGLEEGNDFRVIVGPDQHLLAFIDPESQDIVSYVATLHHHSYIDTPLRAVNLIMKDGGQLVISDWHNPEWEHPNRVYRALLEDYDPDEYGWDTKDDDIKAFVGMFPKALEEAPSLSPLDEASYQQIRKFWQGYARIKRIAREAGQFSEANDILMLEAHIHVEQQNRIVSSAGFNVSRPSTGEMKEREIMKGDPDQLLDDSRLLMTTLAYKR